MSVTIYDQQAYSIAAGFDNVVGLQTLEGYTVTDDLYPFQPVMSWGTFSDGATIVLGSGALAYDGYPSVRWILNYATNLQEHWLSQTFCGGTLTGNVTIATVTRIPNHLEYWNAVLRLPQLPDTRGLRPGFSDYTLTLLLIEQPYGTLLLESGFSLFLQTGGRLKLSGT